MRSIKVSQILHFALGIHVPVIILTDIWLRDNAEPEKVYYYLATLIAMGATAILLVARHWYGGWTLLSFAFVTLGGVVLFIEYFYLSGRISQYLFVLYAIGAISINYLVFNPIPNNSNTAYPFLRVYDLLLLISVLMLWMTLYVYQVPFLHSIPIILVTYYALGDLFADSIRLLRGIGILTTNTAHWLSQVMILILFVLGVLLAISYLIWPPVV